MNNIEIVTEGLQSFINELRLAGYSIGLTQFIAAQNLVLALAKQGVLPNLAQLKTLLAPVVCHSAIEQEEFHWRFDNWVKNLEKPSEEKERVPQEQVFPTKKNKWAIVVAAVVLLMAGLFYQFVPTESDTVPTEPSSARETPSSELPKTTPELMAPESTEPLPELPAQSADLPEEPQAESSEQPVSLLWTIVLLFISLLLILRLLWTLWRRYGARLYFMRKFSSVRPNIKEWSVKGLDKAILQPIVLSRTAQQLRKHIAIDSNILDVVATLEKTVEAGGWLRPVFGSTKCRPEYLVLVDRMSFKDHQAAFVNTLINQLVEEEVSIARYYFEGNPRYCYLRPICVTIRVVG